ISSFDRSTIRPIASSHVVGTSWPLRRIRGIVSRSPLWFASQPWRPFGPSRPWLTRSPARPRTPTMRPAVTPTSIPQPVEHSTQTDGTQRSTSATVRSSTRTGQGPAGWGVRGPQMSSMLLRLSVTSACLPLDLDVLQLVEPLLDPLEHRLHLLVAVLRLRAALVDQVGRGDDQEEDLEELRLPVLERPLAEVDDVATPAEHRRVLALGRLVGDVLPPAEDRVQEEAREEDREHEDAEAVVAPEPLEGHGHLRSGRSVRERSCSPAVREPAPDCAGVAAGVIARLEGAPRSQGGVTGRSDGRNRS